MFVLNSSVLILRALSTTPSPTMTSTTNPPKPPTRDPFPCRSTRDSLPGKGKLPDLRAVPRRKIIPRTVRKNPKIISLLPTMAHTGAKDADGKPVARHSPKEFNQALRKSSLPEDHIISICALSNSPIPRKSKNNKTNKNPSPQDPRHSASILPPTLTFPEPHISPIFPSSSKPSVNPFPPPPHQQIIPTQTNKNKNKKGKSWPLNTTAPAASLTGHCTFPSRNPSSVDISLLPPKICDPSYHPSIIPQLPLPKSPSNTSDPLGSKRKEEQPLPSLNTPS